VFDVYLKKYASSSDEYLRKYDRIYRKSREVIFYGEAYALDKERGYALFLVNRCFPLPGMRAPGTCVLFLGEEMIIFNLARNEADMNDDSCFYNVFKVMPFSPPFESHEKEKFVQGLIMEALAVIGVDGEPYNEKVRLRVVFNVRFDEHIF